MTIESVLNELDLEISRLKQARDFLLNESTTPGGRGKRKKRVLSPEGRARIVAAQSKRWTAQKKSAK